MPETFACYLRVNSGRQNLAGAGVPEIVKPDTGQGGFGDQPHPLGRLLPRIGIAIVGLAGWLLRLTRDDGTAAAVIVLKSDRKN